jgi:hypothetical protein
MSLSFPFDGSPAPPENSRRGLSLMMAPMASFPYQFVTTVAQISEAGRPLNV